MLRWTARVWPAATFQFCFMGALAMVKPAANALVLSRCSVGTLPWLYVLGGLVTGSLAVAVRSGSSRQPVARATAGALGTWTLAAGIGAGLPLVTLGGWLFAEVLATQMSLSFWATVGDAFDAREARRAFTWVNGIGMVGAIAGGLGAQLLARSAGAMSLLLAGGGLLLTAAVAFAFHRSALERPRQSAGAGGVRAVTTSPYARFLGLMVLGFAVVQQLVDFVFRHRASQLLLEADMADLFAAHQLWTGALCVVVQLLAAEVALRRLGILRAVASIPLALAIGCLAVWLVPGVWSAWALKLLESAASWSILPLVMQLLYAPVPDQARDGIRRTIDGFVRKGGMAAAGLVLLMAAGLSLDGVVAITLATCLALVGLILLMRPRYLQAVHQRVAGVQAHRVGEPEERLLGEVLESGSVERALRAADLLEHADVLREHHVFRLLGHPHERAQERGARLADVRVVGGAVRQLESLALRGERRPRAAAMWALSRLSPERARVLLPRALSSPELSVVCAAVGGLFRASGIDEPQATATLRRLLERGPRAPVAERREVTKLLGRLGEAARPFMLKGYLEDSDGTVRRLAMAAVGEAGALELAPRLLRSLSWRDDRGAARQALTALGDRVVPLVASALGDRSRSLSVRAQLPKVLRAIGTPAALSALLSADLSRDPGLAYQAGRALQRLHEERAAVPVSESLVREAMARQQRAWGRLLEPHRDVRASLGAGSVLTRALRDRLNQAVEHWFCLLGLLHDGRALRRAHAHLFGSDPRRRAWALEFLEHELRRDDWALVLEHVERHQRAPPPGDADQVSRHLTSLCRSEDVVVRACARHAGRRGGVWSTAPQEDAMSEVGVRRLFALEGVEVFAECDVDDLAAIAASAREEQFRKGERIYGEGDPGDALYVIVRGSAVARRDGATVRALHAKQSFGETSLFDGAPRIHEVVATSDSSMLVIDRRDFLDLLADRPDLLTGMFRALCAQLNSAVLARGADEVELEAG